MKESIMMKKSVQNKFMHEQVPIHDDMPIIARYFDYEMFTYPWHFHSEYEIIYVEESVGDRFVADSKEPFCPGDVILLGSNLPHHMRSAPQYKKGIYGLRVKGVVIQFKKDFMSHSIQHYADLKQVKSLLEESARGVYFPSPENKNIVKKIVDLPKCKGIERLVNLLILLDAMATFSKRRVLGSTQYSSFLSTFTDDRLEKVLSYMTLHYTEDIHVNQIASMIPMNTAAFCRYFKDKTSKTFTEYIQDLRIGYACKLLLEKSSDIFQICFECGFNTVTHFNRVFKRNTGLTPTAYKEQFLSDN